MPSQSAVRVVLLFLLASAAAPVAVAIVNGTPVSDERFDAEFGWAVALENGPDNVCSAMLIAPRWVLTAAHCTAPGSSVRIGHADRGRAAVRRVAGAYPHPLYDPRSGAFDVGLLRLEEAASAPVVRIAGTTSLVREAAPALILGWGRRASAQGFSQRLVVSDIELRDLLREESRFAYRDAASGPCGGDSGGPLLLRGADGGWLLAGVASRVVGDLCADGGGIGIYTDVAAVSEFIRQHVAEVPAGSSRTPIMRSSADAGVRGQPPR
ncbi:MAG: trypsin-like serine protease [Gammaproteobacteria bacterium]|nr:trypsin-like serine protease [Gammaproteobacteria bacterium]